MTNSASAVIRLPIKSNRNRVSGLRELLVEYCGYGYSKAQGIVTCNDIFEKVKPESLKQSYKVLKDMEYEHYCKTNPELLAIPSIELKKQLQFINDCGMNHQKTIRFVFNFPSILNKQISLLKSFGILLPNTCVIENFRHSLDISPEEFPLEAEETDTLEDIYKNIYQYYLKRELNISDTAWDNIKSNRKYAWNSLRMIKYNIKIIKSIIGHDEQKLNSSLQLMHADPENLLLLIKSNRKLNMKELVLKHPSIATIPCDTFLEKYQILEKNHIPSEALYNNSTWLELESDLIEYRISSLVNSKDLNIYTRHPRFLALVYNNYLANERLHILKAKNMKCHTLNLLCTADAPFLKHLNNGIDKVSTKDICLVLSNELHAPVSEIRKKLKKNPYLGYIPLTVVQQTLAYLREVGFKNEDIFYALQILLYKRKIIENAVQSMEQENNIVMEGVDGKTYLSLILYTIEKDYNFSGSGVWAKCDSTDEFKDDLYTTEV